MKAQTPLTLAGLRRQLAPLQTRWQGRWAAQARRIDALSVRERAIVFLCIAAVLAAVFDTLVLSPLSARSKLRAEAQATQLSELNTLREQFVAVGQGGTAGPVQQLQAQIRTAQAERTRLDQALRTRTAGSADTAGAGLPAVLQRLLAQHPGLSLQRVALLEDSPSRSAAAAPVAAAPAASAPGAGAALPSVKWQGVELQVQGSYANLQRYLQSLEQALPNLRFGRLQLAAAANPSELPGLQLQVFLLKVQP